MGLLEGVVSNETEEEEKRRKNQNFVSRQYWPSWLLLFHANSVVSSQAITEAIDSGEIKTELTRQQK